MTSLLRKIVAGPRSRHPDSDLDLCYVTDEIIATSGPSCSFPQSAYRNPLECLVRFLDERHRDNWAIWEFRAEGTGYPDSEVYDRIWHYPFPDHHPPPFAIVPLAMASMRNWLEDEKAKADAKESGKGGRVVVVHCKAGKGRSGTMACSYLISECGWTPDEALTRFTERRMRSGFGQGVSIPSQLRYIRYVEQWTKQSKIYMEREIEILEVYVWGLREGVKIAVEGYVEDGKIIKTHHVFDKDEKTLLDTPTTTPPPERSSSSSASSTPPIQQPTPQHPPSSSRSSPSSTPPGSRSRSRSGSPFSHSRSSTPSSADEKTTNVLLRPSSPLILPTNDINLDFERRTSPSSYTPASFTMVTSVAHVWFNAFFEAHAGAPAGEFAIDWDKMDGIKGSSKKGTRAMDRVRVVWRARQPAEEQGGQEEVIREPAPGEKVKEVEAADWKGGVDKGKGEEDRSEERRIAGVGLSLVGKGLGDPRTKKGGEDAAGAANKDETKADEPGGPSEQDKHPVS